MRIEYTDAVNFLMNCDNAYILMHQSPDGDTTGAAFGLYYLLKNMGKRAKVLCADELPKRYDFIYEGYENEDFEPEYIIAVDVADIKLLGSLKEIYGDKIDLCIDHHISNTGYAEKTLVRHDASATCEIMYDLTKLMDEHCTDQMARCFYTGIATDTGCFKFENTKANTHKVVSEMMELNKIEYSLINRKMFDIKSKGRIKLEQIVTEGMEFYLEDKCAIISITNELKEKSDIGSSELEGVAALPLQIEGVEVGITIKEKEPDAYKVSMRSAANANVALICGKLGGGGHIRASGCLVRGSLDEVKRKLVETVKEAFEEQGI